MVKLLRRRDFALFWFGGLLGDWVGIVTLLNVDGITYCLAGIMVLVTLRSAPVAEQARPAGAA